ncbi:IclR family transcriptional regulator domain-containing protein [Saccharopolyspora endophytica]|uniref:IclR family transcriptional regulator domain-containing protein n=1 Tax=Saccharopolyspora endophytica TaxID=543886 RepID=UPI003556DEF9
MAAYRRDGFAVGAREFHDGVHGFAAGVTDRAGAGVAALSLTSLGTRLSRGARREIGTVVRAAAPEVSRNLTTGRARHR